MKEKVAEFITQNTLFGTQKHVLLAISGGADSIAMMNVLCALRNCGRIKAELSVGHINHQLRGSDSDGDSDFVVAQAKKHGLDVAVRRVDVRRFAEANKLSIETAARTVRMAELTDIAHSVGCSYIATAHHKNDNAETIIHRIEQGCGFRGLAGIWPKKEFTNGITFIRPMLCLGRYEIDQYLDDHDISCRQDKTNYDCSYTRNRIRHLLLPALQKEADGCLVEKLSQLTAHCRSFYRNICAETEQAWTQCAITVDSKMVELDLRKFTSVIEPIQIELIRKALGFLGAGQRNLGKIQFRQVLALAENSITGKTIELPGGFVAIKADDMLSFAPTVHSTNNDILEPVSLQVPGKTRFGKWLIETSLFNMGSGDLENFKAVKTHFVEWFDREAVEGALTARMRQKADRFEPIGLGAEKKVGKLLTDEKVDYTLRKEVFVIADEAKIIWLTPIRASENSKIRHSTKMILQIKVCPN